MQNLKTMEGGGQISEMQPNFSDHGGNSISEAYRIKPRDLQPKLQRDANDMPVKGA
jgi:hypothetical protein